MISNEDSIPKRSAAGLASRDIFYQQFNDVRFYVEDERQENLYLAILKKLFPRIRIEQIFALRGKDNVLKHARDPVNAKDAHRSVYILDKDFDDLLGRKVTEPNVFYLDRYCIENFLLEENAGVQIVLEAQPGQSLSSHKARLALRSFLSRTERMLDPLFRAFFAVQKFGLGMKNCDSNPHEFSIGGTNCEIDRAKVKAYTKAVCKEVLRNASLPSEKAFVAFLSRAFPRTGPRHANISGKFILVLTFRHIRSRVKLGTITFDSFRYRLARHCGFKGLRPLQRSVKSYLMGVRRAA